MACNALETLYITWDNTPPHWAVRARWSKGQEKPPDYWIEPSLAMVCKAIREDVLSVYYQLNKFVVHRQTKTSDTGRMKMWKQCLGLNLRHLRTVRVYWGHMKLVEWVGHESWVEARFEAAIDVVRVEVALTKRWLRLNCRHGLELEECVGGEGELPLCACGLEARAAGALAMGRDGRRLFLIVKRTVSLNDLQLVFGGRCAQCDCATFQRLVIGEPGFDPTAPSQRLRR